MAGCEHNNLELFIGFLQALHYIRPQINARTDSLFAWEVDFENNVRVLSIDVIDTVNKGFIHVEDK